MSFDHLNELLRTQRQRLQSDWNVEREMHKSEMREAEQKQRELQNQLHELVNFKNTINGVFEERKAEWEEAAKNREKKLKDELEAKWKGRVGKLMERLNSLEAKKQEELDELTEKIKKMEAENNEMNRLVDKMKNEETVKQEEIDKLAKMMKKMSKLVENMQNDEAKKEEETNKLITQMKAEMDELKKLHDNEMAQIEEKNRQKLEKSELRCDELEKKLELLMKQNVVDHQIERRRHQSKREHQIESENNETKDKLSPKRQKIDANATATPSPLKDEPKQNNLDDDITYIGTTRASETPKVEKKPIPLFSQQQNSMMTPSPIIQQKQMGSNFGKGIVGSAVTLSNHQKLQNAIIPQQPQKMANQPLAVHVPSQQIGHSSAQSTHSPAPIFENGMVGRLADLNRRLNQIAQENQKKHQKMVPPMHPYKQP